MQQLIVKSKLQKPRPIILKKCGKYLEYDCKQNDLVKHFVPLNSENVPLLMSTISFVDAEIGR